MRLVLDTNVVFSALLWEGAAHQFLQTVRAQPHIQFFSSMALIEELADVFTRKEAVKRLLLIRRSADEVLADYVRVVQLVSPAHISATSIDPDDDVVLATALAARADVIVSGDRKHLLVLHEFQGIPILSPAQACEFVVAG